jgi:hypothetical protein
MLSLNSFKTDLNNWELLSQDSEKAQFKHKQHSDFLTLWLQAAPPQYQCPLEDTRALSRIIRKDVLKANGGIISLNNLFLSHIPAFRCVLKFPDENLINPFYTASLHLLFKDFSFVMKVQSHSDDNWEERDKIVKEQLLQATDSAEQKSRLLKNWTLDPYLPKIRKGLLKTRSDEEVFDKQFPDHALSRARKNLLNLEEKLQIHETVNQLPVYKPGLFGRLMWW